VGGQGCAYSPEEGFQAAAEPVDQHVRDVPSDELARRAA
jgi:hypothetical protein